LGGGAVLREGVQQAYKKGKRMSKNFMKYKQ